MVNCLFCSNASVCTKCDNLTYLDANATNKVCISSCTVSELSQFFYNKLNIQIF